MLKLDYHNLTANVIIHSIINVFFLIKFLIACIIVYVLLIPSADVSNLSLLADYSVHNPVGGEIRQRLRPSPLPHFPQRLGHPMTIKISW